MPVASGALLSLGVMLLEKVLTEIDVGEMAGQAFSRGGKNDRMRDAATDIRIGLKGVAETHNDLANIVKLLVGDPSKSDQIKSLTPAEVLAVALAVATGAVRLAYAAENLKQAKAELDNEAKQQ